MDIFKVPSGIPQDLLLIHDLVGVPNVTDHKIDLSVDESMEHPGSDVASEDEVAADLVVISGEAPGDRQSDSSSSESESESTSDPIDADADERASNMGEDDEEINTATEPTTLVRTTNEIMEAEIMIPDVNEVGPDEILEKVGEIAIVMGNTVIIRSLPTERPNHGSERALDSDTLLVFRDRKVLGYIYETFGPTSQPLYQVRFNTKFPIDLERVKISHEVFHIPKRSNFVFLSYLKSLKGSDASNVHDEEPAEHELEFSDDEAEAAHKALFKKKRSESRAHSLSASSRQTTPSRQIYDDDTGEINYLSRNPYDEHGPYDIDFSAGPSRPPPAPYDDPYSDSYTIPTPPEYTPESLPKVQRDKYTSFSSHGDNNLDVGSRNKRSRGGRDFGDSRGLGRGRGGGRRRGGSRKYSSDHHQLQTSNHDADNSRQSQPVFGQDAGMPFEPQFDQSHSSFSIPQGNGQPMGYGTFATPYTVPRHAPAPTGSWGYTKSLMTEPVFGLDNMGYHSDYVQPHINPRFVNTFGMAFELGQPSQQIFHANSRPVSRSTNQADNWMATETNSDNVNDT